MLAFLAALLGRLAWHLTTRDTLERARLWILPVLNPVGMARGTRANGRGVDLMRNAPGDDVGRATPLVGGQRLAAWLPWYRGVPGAPMEPEAAALVRWVQGGSSSSRPPRRRLAPGLDHPRRAPQPHPRRRGFADWYAS